ncbi:MULTISPECIES: FtsH protease activity modulator HflK [Thalassolituus]|jgi:membrane protease subunit HflK|uniref:Protein HflK n=2 Tax=Thalassolituus TaxID=187492 RepID=A0A1N7NQ04_9GAMM|nr:MULTISPECIES: FtsH protease activity modulator HflK [Thalassolituus]MAX86721.1 protease modulator HflK [Oceanospirillaceae bacterium]MEE3191737.1 FtsH protease activity modulator HflK [Pseudomonadota bacterium]TPD55647.1 MAG: FtsH protease activity modulator HflK [Thalassolituus maritimus]SIT00309.1 protease FtsH subunit HflK [Thalassolituus maritimus]|tara:strand:- start:31013 stop:32200 length:1188 start_codon:yes stop_codon:yes gene_type:complete
MAWNEPGGNGNKPKDPWGNNNRGNGGGGGNQPPDLDEVIRKLTDKLNGLFGGKKSGGNNNNGGDGSITGFLVVAAVIAAILLAMNSVYILDTQERGVVLRTGKFDRIEGEGLNWKLPVIEDVIIVNATRVRETEIRESMLTEDENIVDVKLNVQYRVTDPVSYALRVEDPELTLRDAAESALRHEVGSTEMDPILTTGRVVLAEAVKQRLQFYMDEYNTGITLQNVNIKDATPPAAVKEAFDDVQRAKQDKERTINDAEAYANSVVPEARGRAQRQLEEARAYRERVVARAEGEADRFTKLLSEYNKAPAVTRERLYIDAVTQVYNKSSKVLVDVEGGNNMMYLPLDKLTQQAQGVARQSDLSDEDIKRLTDEVIREANSRRTSGSSSTIRREGR